MVCGQGAPVYSWYKDGIPLNSSSYLVEKDERIVVVTNETQNPFGLYTCNASGIIRQWYLSPVQESRGRYICSYSRCSWKGKVTVQRCEEEERTHTCFKQWTAIGNLACVYIYMYIYNTCRSSSNVFYNYIFYIRIYSLYQSYI